MYREGFINRVIELLNVNNISGYKLSLNLGKSKNYINNILHGNHMPSIDEFFNMCTFFHVSPAEFFEYEREGHSNDVLSIAEKLSMLGENDITLVKDFIDRLLEKTDEQPASVVYIDDQDEIADIPRVAENSDDE